MSYVIFIATRNMNVNDHYPHVEREETEDFEDMMRRFALYSYSTGNVLVIENKTKKVICYYQREGKMIFNKYLLDGTIYSDNIE